MERSFYGSPVVGVAARKKWGREMAQGWWFEARPEDAPLELGQALEAAGLQRATGEPPGASVLIVSGDAELDCELLARLSGQGRERVLAVIPPGMELGARICWRYLSWGASDVIAWHSPASCAEVLARLDRWAEIDALVASPLIQSNLLGQSTAWLIAVRNVVEFARFASSPVLILGESGTGKELAARVIHALDPRPQKRDLVVLDCSTIVPELSGSEFYGHERGAFTGAAGARQGAFELAHEGTLFLDEVGELPLHLQAQLLRVIQERTYKRVGGNNWQQTEFRLVCATNRDLAAEVTAGRFRRDLFHRITSAPLLPATAARPPGGHPPAGPPLPAGVPARSAGAGPGPRRPGAAAVPRVSGQRPRAAAGDDPHRQPPRGRGAHHPGRCAPFGSTGP